MPSLLGGLAFIGKPMLRRRHVDTRLESVDVEGRESAARRREHRGDVDAASSDR